MALKQGRYKCECPPGWEGQHCEENIGKCVIYISLIQVLHDNKLTSVLKIIILETLSVLYFKL